MVEELSSLSETMHTIDKRLNTQEVRLASVVQRQADNHREVLDLLERMREEWGERVGQIQAAVEKTERRVSGNGDLGLRGQCAQNAEAIRTLASTTACLREDTEDRETRCKKEMERRLESLEKTAGRRWGYLVTITVMILAGMILFGIQSIHEHLTGKDKPAPSASKDP